MTLYYRSFLDIVKKTQAQKNSKLKQNLQKKLKQNPEKTQKPPTSVELRWWIFFTNPKVFPHFCPCGQFLKL